MRRELARMIARTQRQSEISPRGRAKCISSGGVPRGCPVSHLPWRLEGDLGSAYVERHREIVACERAAAEGGIGI